MNKKINIIFVICIILVPITIGCLVGINSNDSAINNAFNSAFTSALVLVTAYYAVTTYNLMRATNKQANIALEAQFNAAVPVISLHANNSSHSVGQMIAVDFLNIGKGPALNLRCWIEDTNFPELKGKLISIAALEVALENIAITNYISIDIPDYKLGSGYIKAQYESIFGITYESSLMFPANSEPQLKWGKANYKNNINITDNTKIVEKQKDGERAIWLSIVIFSAAVIFQGFHNDCAFWIAGGLGIVIAGLGYFLKWKP